MCSVSLETGSPWSFMIGFSTLDGDLPPHSCITYGYSLSWLFQAFSNVYFRGLCHRLCVSDFALHLASAPFCVPLNTCNYHHTTGDMHVCGLCLLILVAIYSWAFLFFLVRKLRIIGRSALFSRFYPTFFPVPGGDWRARGHPAACDAEPLAGLGTLELKILLEILIGSDTVPSGKLTVCYGKSPCY